MAAPLQNKNKPLMFMKSKEINVNGKFVEVLVPFSGANNSNMTTFVGEMKKTGDFINKQPIFYSNKVMSNLAPANQGNYAATGDNFVNSAATLSNFQLPRISHVESLSTSTQGSNLVSVDPKNCKTNGGNFIRLVPSQLQNSQQPRIASFQTLVKTLPVTQTSCKASQPVYMLVPYGSNVNLLNTPGGQQNTRYIINPNKPAIVNPSNNKSESSSILVKNSNIAVVSSAINANSTTADTQINIKSLLNPDKDFKSPTQNNVKMQKVITDLLHIANSKPIPSVSVVRQPVKTKVNTLSHNDKNFLKANSCNPELIIRGMQSSITVQQQLDPGSSTAKRRFTENEISKEFQSSANISQSKNSTSLKETEDSGQAYIDERKAKRMKLDASKTWIPPASDEDDIQIISEISASNKPIEIIDLDEDENTNVKIETDTIGTSSEMNDDDSSFKGSSTTSTSQSQCSSNTVLDTFSCIERGNSEQSFDQNGLETLPANKTVNQLFSGSLSDISSNLIQAAPIYKVPICPQNVILNGQVPSSKIPILPKDSVVRNIQLPPYLPSSASIASTGAVLQGANTYIIKGLHTNRGNTTQLINSVAPRPIMASTITKPCKQQDVTKVLLPVANVPNLPSGVISNASNANIMNLGSAPKVLRTYTHIPTVSRVSTKISNSNVLNNSIVKTATISLPRTTYVSSQSTLPLSSIVTTGDQVKIQPRTSPVKVTKTAEVASNNAPVPTIGHAISGKYLSSGSPGNGFVKACFTVPVIDIAKKIIILPQGNVCYLDAENKLYKGNFTCRLPKPLDKPYLISCNFPETAGETCKENSLDEQGSKQNPGTKSQKYMNISIFYKMDAHAKKDSVASKTQLLPATELQSKGQCQLSLNSCYSYKKSSVSRAVSPSSSSTGDTSSSDSDWGKSYFSRTYEKKKHKKKKIYNWSSRGPPKSAAQYQDFPKTVCKSFDTDSGNSSDIDFNLFFPEVELIEEEGKKVNIPYILPEKSPKRFKITNHKVSPNRMKAQIQKKIADLHSRGSPNKRKIPIKKRSFVSHRNSRSQRSDSRKKVRRSHAYKEKQKVTTYIEKKSKPFTSKPPVYPSLLSYCSVLLDPLDTSVLKDGSIDLSETSLENLFLIFKRDRNQLVDENNTEEEIPLLPDEVETEAEEAPPVLIDMNKELEDNSMLENDVENEESPPVLTDMLKEMTPPVLNNQVQDCKETKTEDSPEADLKCLVYKTEKFTHLIPLTNVISLPNKESEELLPALGGESLPKSTFKISSFNLSSSKSLVSSPTALTKDVPPIIEMAKIASPQEDGIELSDKTQKSFIKSNDNNAFLNDIENASQNSTDSDFPSLRIQKLREKFLKSLAEAEKIKKERNGT